MKKTKRWIARILCVGLLYMTMIPIFAEDVMPQTQGKVVVFMYHNFVKGALGIQDDPSYCTTDTKFEWDILTLKALGYQSMNLEQYYFGEYDPTQNYFIFTFDDGYASNYQIAYPILQKYQVYADIFVNTEASGLSNHFSFSDANEMEASGLVKVYSHFTKHLDVTTLSTEKFRQMAIQAYEKLEKRLKLPRLRIFSYPYGLYTQETCQIMDEIGTAFQVIQKLPEEWDATTYPFIFRVNVAYESEISQLIERYLARINPPTYE